jgi:hypothetical protein
MKLDFSDTYKPPLAFTQIIGPNGIGQLPVQSHSVSEADTQGTAAGTNGY